MEDYFSYTAQLFNPDEPHSKPEALKGIENVRIIEKSLRRELMTREDLIERLALFECSSSGRSVHRTPRKGYRWDREGTDRLHRERRRHIGAHL